MKKRKTIPNDTYLVSFELTTMGDEFFRTRPSLKKIREMIIDELAMTKVCLDIDPEEVRVLKLHPDKQGDEK